MVSPEEQPAITPKIIDTSKRAQPTESQMVRTESRQENTLQENRQEEKSDHTPAKPLNTPNDGRLQTLVTTDLCQGGVLSLSLPGYEERPAQVEMASVVSQAITQYVPAVVEAATGTGKALDVDTPIPTPTGWKRMGDLVTGDLVFDEKGHPTRVTAAFDIMRDHKCYEVIFSDGSSLIADAEHEWISYTCTDRKRAGQQRTDTYMAKNFVTSDKLVMLDKLIVSSTSGISLSVSGAVTLVGGHQWSVLQAARKIEPINPGKRPACYPRLALLTSLRSRLARDLDEQCRDGRAYSLVTTEQMAATLTMGSSARANHAILVAGALTLPDADLPIDPYFLGVWLGDGSSYSNQIKTADPDLITEIEKAGYSVRSLRSNPYLYAVDDKNGKAVSRWQPGMTGRLRALGLVQNKHIPKIYLRTSAQQRRALLAGLLDTDGTVSHCGATEFTTTSPQLAQDVYELVCSLGFRSTLHEGRARLRGKDCGPKWTLAFTTDQQVFRLERKIAVHKERLRNYSPERNRFRYVVEVREVPSRPVRCIQVDSPSHLYLAGRSMIPTHNSLAYLVPVVRSGQVAIISTANKALQEQLFYKDIPFVQKYIKPFGAALVKGMGNYICVDRVESERVGIQFFTKNREFARLVELINDPDALFNGDIETLGFQLPADIRGKVTTDSDQCAWNKCDYFSDCYVRQMRENAQQARVIVVNHTLLLLDAAMGGFLLPERDVIILDEAHHLEEEATRCFTITINSARIQTLLAQHLLKDHSLASLQDETRRNAEAAWMLLEQVADPGAKGRANLNVPFEAGLRLATSISDLTDSLERQRPKEMPDKESQLYDKLLKRADKLAEDIRTVFSVAQPDKFVYYVERTESPGKRGIVLQASAAPLDVTAWLKERLFNKCNVICTSATLATVGPNPAKPEEKGPNFGYFRQRVGLDPQERSDVLERILPLTFDYESNALLYLPRDLPAPTFGPGSEDYMLAIAREMYKLVKVSRGRAFLLFSSKRMLDHAYELMSPHLSYPLLKQGDMPRVELTRRFRQEEGAILFGLKSFWEGVDIAGDALSLVVIDKLPFDPPDDPVHEARIALMKAKNENWFGTYVLPQAVLRLKQGIGRLLRTRGDRGVMAILDTRLHTKGYGRLVLDALPPARRTSSLRDIDRFFAEE
jgi:Rad3-related DNA helicase